MSHDVDVVVVGAGAAGLRCASVLREQGFSVAVLEARDRVGGRTFGKEYKGYLWDIGGQWVGPGQDRAYALAKQYNIPIFPQWQKGKKVLEYNGKTKKYSGTIPPLNIFALIELQLHISWLDSWSKKVTHQRTYSKQMSEWDSLSVQGYMDKYMWSSGAKNLFHIGVIAVFSCEPKEISMLFLLHYCRGAGSFMKLLEVPNGAQQDRVEGGLYQLSLHMAKDLGDIVKLNHEVTKISREGNRVHVHCKENIFKAKQVVVCIPPILCDKISYEPELPMTRQHLTQRMPMGQVIKFIIFYSQPFWRTAGFCGEVTTTRESVSVLFDACVKENYALVGFFEGQAARVWSEKTDEERKKEVADLVFRAFNDKQGLEPTGYLEQDWQREKWSLGGYTGVCPAGVLTGLGEALDKPCWDNTLHWGGTETSFVWPGYVEGALCSGEVCAQRVTDMLRTGRIPEPSKPSTSSESSLPLRFLLATVVGAAFAALYYTFSQRYNL